MMQFTRSSNWVKQGLRGIGKSLDSAVCDVRGDYYFCSTIKFIVLFRSLSPSLRLCLSPSRYVSAHSWYQSFDFFSFIGAISGIDRSTFEMYLSLRQYLRVSCKFLFFIRTRCSWRASFPNRLLLIYLCYSSHMIIDESDTHFVTESISFVSDKRISVFELTFSSMQWFVYIIFLGLENRTRTRKTDDDDDEYVILFWWHHLSLIDNLDVWADIIILSFFVYNLYLKRKNSSFFFACR